MNEAFDDFLHAELGPYRKRTVWTKNERAIESPQGSEIDVPGAHVINLCANNYPGAGESSRN